MSTQKQKSNSFSQFPHTNSPEMQALTQCLTTCEACAKKCIEEGHKSTAVICGECAKVCDLAIQFKSCDSQWEHQVMDLCAQICRSCANECSRMPAQHCQECAEACRRCMEACMATPSVR